ncbi:MAG: outer membrane beta-barrel protein [Saprospiraceae bacterium]
MKKQLFLFTRRSIFVGGLLLIGTFALQLNAQTVITPSPSTDTFRIRNFPLVIRYAEKKIKKPKQAQSILLAKNDPQINRDWQTSKTLRNVGLGIQILGLGVEAIGLAKTLNSDGGDENNLVLKGVGIMLGGVILQAIGTGPMKRAMRRYNGLQTGRIRPTVAPPIPTIYKAKSPVAEADTTPPPAPSPAKKFSKGFVAGATWGGAAIGLGWSKQKLNYEEFFDKPLKRARVFSYALQYGKQVSETLGWQIELGLTQHGYREEQTGNTGGVKTTVKADLRVRYLEVPFLLNLKLPIGGQNIRLEAMPGASVGFLNSAKVIAHGEGAQDDTKVRVKISSKLDLREVKFEDKLDAALLLGLRAAKRCGPGRIFLEGRYHFGILNLERNAETGPEDEKPKAFNRTFLLRAGYQIPLQ